MYTYIRIYTYVTRIYSKTQARAEARTQAPATAGTQPRAEARTHKHLLLLDCGLVHAEHAVPAVYTAISVRQHTSAYVRIRQDTSGYVRIRQHTSADLLPAADVLDKRQPWDRTSAYTVV